jgi:inner membrane protein
VDFITQNLLGAVAGHAACGRPRGEGGLGRLALLAGSLGGAVPDFDFLLGPLADPALPFELHRHFTHSLAFIPIGGVLATLPLLALPRARRQVGRVCAAATVGCATHGLLDTLTSYGTHLLWPFVAHRTAWDAMSIVDPLFTGVLLLGVLAALIRGRPRPTRLALTLALTYIAFGFSQHARALDAQRALARERGHEIAHGRALPTLGNVVVFRSIYEAEGRLWADAVHVAPFGSMGVRTGTAQPRLTADDLPADAPARAWPVFRGLESFADGFVGRVDPAATGDERLTIGDMRFSLDTTGFRPLWGIVLDERGRPAAWDAFHRPDERARDALRALLDDVVRPEGRFRPLPRERASP